MTNVPPRIAPGYKPGQRRHRARHDKILLLRGPQRPTTLFKTIMAIYPRRRRKGRLLTRCSKWPFGPKKIELRHYYNYGTKKRQ